MKNNQQIYILFLVVIEPLASSLSLLFIVFEQKVYDNDYYYTTTSTMQVDNAKIGYNIISANRKAIKQS